MVLKNNLQLAQSSNVPPTLDRELTGPVVPRPLDAYTAGAQFSYLAHDVGHCALNDIDARDIFACDIQKQRLNSMHQMQYCAAIKRCDRAG